MTSVFTFWAKVYVGFREGRTADAAPTIRTMAEAQAVVQAFVDAEKDKGGPCGCVTMTPTRYVYGDGWEDGVEVGFINYPRFPGSTAFIRGMALDLAERLRVALGQQRVSVMFPGETVMLP